MQKSHKFEKKNTKKRNPPKLGGNMLTSLFQQPLVNPPSFSFENPIQKTSATWRCQIFFCFNPYLGEWSNLTNIFQMRWNHQLVRITSRPPKRRSKISPSCCVARPCSDSWVRRSWRWQQAGRTQRERWKIVGNVNHQKTPFIGCEKKTK